MKQIPKNCLFKEFISLSTLLMITFIPLKILQAEEKAAITAEEIGPQELEAAKALLFQTEYLKKMLVQLKKANVRWFFLNYRDKDKIVFEFRDKREDMDHYPFICRLAVNLRTKECFEQGCDDQRIH